METYVFSQNYTTITRATAAILGLLVLIQLNSNTTMEIQISIFVKDAKDFC